MLDKAYDAQKYERNIYSQWENSHVFAPKNKGQGTHINILPPPNANGSLHLGHAAGYTIMDIAGRFARMNGKETLLLPGKDHAGILTQTVFEKKLLEETGKDRYALGREDFFNQCYDFCIESAEIMRSQEKRIGLSADWNREKFTLDPTISNEVLSTFVDMYNEGIAYKGNRIINWCPYCQTALSDMEVEHKETEGEIWDLKYPLADGSGHVIVATTRPETMLGDTAVAVHPDDTRYTNLVGKKLLLPIVNREIPIVTDDEIDMEFGSGAVKVTPAHDPLDYQIGQRNNLEEIQVIGLDGKMTAEAGSDFEGLSVKEARKKVVAQFETLGLLGEVKKHNKPLSVHDRCGNTVEPLISEQWWINTDHEKFSLKKHALDAVKSGRIKIVPEHFEKTFYHWMENLQDWCVSRQLWWGHQIPAWYCDDCNHMEVSTGTKTEIFYIRHGETDVNVKNCFNSPEMNVGITENGKQQIRDQIDEIKKINPDVIIASPTQRTRESAEIISEALGKEVIIDERLREKDKGDFSGRPKEEVCKEQGWEHASFVNFSDCPNGESFEDIKYRAKSAIDDIAEKYEGKKVLIVSHRSIQRILRHTEKGMTPETAIAYPAPNGGLEVFTRTTPPKACSKCGSTNIHQDEDTFDTWFSSGQWAHNTVEPFGEGKYFPGDLMVMGRDILFFWACRMIMMSLYHSRGEKVPFDTLYLTGLILDRDGKKMSKSKGNGIDPLEMADKYGTDALRLSLFIGNTPGNDMRLYEEKIEGYRNFVNKLWNASRFVQMSLENAKEQTSYSEADKWILSRTNALTEEITKAVEEYRYSEAGQKLYDFTWNEFCDWYLELSKGDKQNPYVLTEVLKTLLTLLHPFVPFVTETLWQELGFAENGLLALQAWPQAKDEWNHPEAEARIDLLVELISTIRSLRSESKVDPVKKIEGIIIAQEEHKQFFEDNAEEIKKIARFETLEITDTLTSDEQTVTQVISHGIEIHLPLAGMVDLEQEKARLAKEIEATEKQLQNLDGRLANEKYVNSAPAVLVEQTRTQRTETAEKLEKLQAQLSAM